MALVLTEPFDNFTAAPWSASSFSIVAGGRRGNGAQSSGTALCTYNIPSGQVSDVLTVGFAVKVSALASSRAVFNLRGSSGGLIQNTITFEADGSIGVRRGAAGATFIGQTAAGLVVANIWYYVELQIKLHDTLGVVILRLNEVERLNLTGVDTNPSTNLTYDAVQLQSVSGGTHVFDDLYLRNDTTFQGDPTVSRYLHAWPNANVPTTYAQTSAFEIGTCFSAVVGVTIRGVRIWNPGLGPHTGRSAKLWECGTSAWVGGTKVAEVTLPDTMPTGWSDWEFPTPYVVTNKLLVASYDVGGSGVNDIGHYTISTGTSSADGQVTFPANMGCYSTNVDNPPTINFINEFWGIDVLYSAVSVGVNAKVWNGTAFVDGAVKTWDGSAYVAALAAKTWNGSAFV